jgi:hypothetical protein
MREVIACDQGHYGFTQVTIKLNTRQVWVTEDVNREQQKLTYDQIVQLARDLGYKRKCPSVVVLYKQGKEKAVEPGQSCVVEEDMSIDVGVTNNA